MYDRFRKIILPFCFTAVLYTAIYTFLNWFLVVKNKMFSFSPAFVSGELAFILAWIPALIWLRPRIALLEIRKLNRYYFLFFYQLLATVLLMYCVRYTQPLLYLKMHGYRQLASVEEVEKYTGTDYFFIRSYFLDTSVHPAFRTVYQDDTSADSADLAIYICSPMYKNAKDTAAHLADYWLGMEYRKKISSKVNQESVPFLLKDFDAMCEPQFQKDVRKKTGYYEKVDDKSLLSEVFDDAADKAALDVTGADRFIFIPHRTPYKSIVSKAWAKIVFAFFAVLILWTLAIAFLPFRLSVVKDAVKEEDDLPYPERENIIGKFFSFLYPKENYIVTPWLLYGNAFMFLAMLFSFTGFFSFPTYILYNYGGNLGYITIHGHAYWRLLTSGFEHQGVVHFVSNMFFLVIIGMYLEPVIGKWKMLLLYFTALVFAGIVSAYYNWNLVAVGASGAIMGLFGAFYVLVLTKSTHQKISALFIWSLGIYTLINFLLGFLYAGIDNGAHLGGLAAGIVLGFIYMPFVRKEYRQSKAAALSGEGIVPEPQIKDTIYDYGIDQSIY